MDKITNFLKGKCTQLLPKAAEAAKLSETSPNEADYRVFIDFCKYWLEAKIVKRGKLRLNLFESLQYDILKEGQPRDYYMHTFYGTEKTERVELPKEKRIPWEPDPFSSSPENFSSRGIPYRIFTYYTRSVEVPNVFNIKYTIPDIKKTFNLALKVFKSKHKKNAFFQKYVKSGNAAAEFYRLLQPVIMRLLHLLAYCTSFSSKINGIRLEKLVDSTLRHSVPDIIRGMHIPDETGAAVGHKSEVLDDAKTREEKIRSVKRAVTRWVNRIAEMAKSGKYQNFRDIFLELREEFPEISDKYVYLNPIKGVLKNFYNDITLDNPGIERSGRTVQSAVNKLMLIVTDDLYHLEAEVSILSAAEGVEMDYRRERMRLKFANHDSESPRAEKTYVERQIREEQKRLQKSEAGKTREMRQPAKKTSRSTRQIYEYSAGKTQILKPADGKKRGTARINPRTERRKLFRERAREDFTRMTTPRPRKSRETIAREKTGGAKPEKTMKRAKAPEVKKPVKFEMPKWLKRFFK